MSAKPIFTPEFLDSLPDQPVSAARAMLHRIINFPGLGPKSPQMIQAIAIYTEYIRQTDVTKLVALNIRNTAALTSQIEHKISDYLTLDLMALEQKEASITGETATLEARDVVQALLQKKLGLQHNYKFTEQEFGSLQEKLNSLRDAVKESDAISIEHKNRILKKIELVQSELHIEVPTLDRLFSFMLDSVVLSRKFGKEVLKVTVIFQSIFSILSDVVKRTEEIKDGFFLMPVQSDKDDDYQLPEDTSEKNIDRDML